MSDVDQVQSPPLTVAEAYRRAQAHEAAGRLDEAEQMLLLILNTVPHQPEALHLLGVIMARRSRLDQAAALIERALPHAGQPALMHRNLGEIYRRQGQLDPALLHGRRASALAPRDPHAWLNLAIIAYDCRAFAEGIAASRQALALQPDLPGAHFELAEALLATGAYTAGWDEYEWRYAIEGATPALPSEQNPLRRPHWDGRALYGTLLLIGDQGFGDTLQFARFLPWAAKLCTDLVVACAPELRRLVGTLVPQARVLSRWDTLPAWDAWCPLTGLARLYGATPARLPASMPYLRSDPDRRDAWRQRLDHLVPRGYARIAIAWSGRPTHNNDANRSAALACFAPFARLRNVALLSLQKGVGQAQIGTYLEPAPLLNLGPSLQDFDDTAAVLDCVDLLVSVDTAVVHLAGALGRPAWMAVPFAADWRWLQHGETTAWYSSLRLFRQTSPRDWDAVFARMQAAWVADAAPRSGAA